MMKRIDTKLPGVYIVEPQVFGDQRGYFMETYNKKAFEDIGITAEFVQDNQSYSAQKGILRAVCTGEDGSRDARRGDGCRC